MIEIKRLFIIAGIILAVVVVIAIFFFSSQTGTESSGLSQRISKALLRLFYPDYTSMSPREIHLIIMQLEVVVRKGAHLTIFMTLGFVIMLTLLKTRMGLFARGLIAVGLCFAYACIDETRQLFTAGRNGSFYDVIIDTTGAVIGVILFVVIFKLRRRMKRIRQENS